MKFAVKKMPPLVVLFVLAFSARAADQYWNAGSGTWSDAANWASGIVPVYGDNVYVNNSGTAFHVSGSSLVGRKGSANYGGIHIGTANGSRGALVVSGGILTTYDTANPESVPQYYHIYVGGNGMGANTGAGSVLVNGGTLQGAVIVGQGVGSRGEITVANGGLLDAYRVGDGWLRVGDRGYGLLTVSGSGDRVLSYDSIIGGYATGAGHVVLEDGAFWNNRRLIHIGGQNAGSLTVKGGTVLSDFIYMASASTGSGTLTLDRGLVNTGSALRIGDTGKAVLYLNSGTINAKLSYIGHGAGSSGTVVVNDGVWSAGQLVVSHSGAGVLQLNNGRVSSTTGFIGNAGTAGGAVSVSGSGYWQNSSALYVGVSGSGSLSIAGSGSVSNTIGHIGYAGAGAGGVSVSGAGYWRNSNALYVGVSGSGGLSVAGSGSVQSAFGYLSYGTAARGGAGLSGDALWRVTGAGAGSFFYNGYNGGARLAISDAARLEIGGTYFQNNRSSLDITLGGNRSTPFITADSATLSGTLNLAGAGTAGTFAKSSELAGTARRIIIHTTNGITGNFDTVTGVTGTGLPDYITGGALIVGGTDYVAGHVLSWSAGGTDAHGTFTLAAGDAFEVDTVLAGTTANPAKGWDGQTLSKNGGGLLTLSGTNTYGGGTVIHGGTLAVLAAGAPGTGTVAIEPGATALFDSFSGTLANPAAGAGDAIIGPAAALAVAGDNRAFTGAWIVRGSGTMTAPQHLGATGAAAVNIAAGGALALVLGAADCTFDQPLAGSGALLLQNTGSLAFGAATGAAFTGTVTLRDNRFTLDAAHPANAAALGAATLKIDTGNLTDVADGRHRTGHLTLQSGTIKFTLDATGTAAAGWIETGILDLAAAGDTVVMIDAARLSDSQIALLRQDEGATIPLVSATALAAGGRATAAQLLDQSGAVLDTATRRDILQGGRHVADGTYDFAATAGTVAAVAGLWLDYTLTALDLLAGETTVLDNETDLIPGADELHARVTGAGNLQISATSRITLTASNSYTGATTVATGTLRTAATGALGRTALLRLAPAAAAALDGTAQSIGALDTAAGSTLDLGAAGALTLARGGTAAGALAGSGAARLRLDGGLLHVTSANPALDIGTSIAAGAAARLAHVDALGSGSITIENGGTLALAPAASGTLRNPLAGAGALVKTGSAAVTIARANSALSGPVALAAGRLVALGHLDAPGTGGITIAGGATLEYAALTGTLAATLAGAGEVALTGTTTLTLGRADALAATLAVKVDRSRLILAAPGVNLGHVTLDHAMLGFRERGPAAQPFFTATTARLDAVQSTLALNVDFDAADAWLAARPAAGRLVPAGQAADHLTVAARTGALGVLVFPAGASASGGASIELITDAATAHGGGGGPGGAAYYLVDPNGNAIGGLMSGLDNYILAAGNGAPGTPRNDTWYLTSQGLSETGDAIIGIASMLGRDWHYAMDSLHQRMGDVRADFFDPQQLASAHAANGATRAAAAAKRPAGDIWVRGRIGGIKADNRLTGRAFTQQNHGLNAGADHAFATASGDAVRLFGVFLDIAGAHRDFSRHGTSESRGTGLGLYGTWLHQDGWHADLVAKAETQTHKFEARDDASGAVAKGRYRAVAQGISLEFGRRVEFRGGWWLEPAGQAALAWFDHHEYETTPAAQAVRVAVAAARSSQYRGMLRLGRRPADGGWFPYGKLGAAWTDTQGGAITADGRTFVPHYDGWRFEAGLGAAIPVGARTQVYFDCEYAKAARYERPWSFNLGCRHLW
jgi:outer membrane autotransporter protein